MTGIRLELLGDSHVAAVADLVEDADTQRFTRIPVPPPDDFARTWIEAYERGRSDGSREGFAIVDDAGTFLGLALAVRIEREAAEVELGYVVAPAARGRGVATEALRLLTSWAFEELAAQRIELVISVDNPASRRVAERCGYVCEGVLRSVYVKPGVRDDAELWSRLPTDP
jgi:RimJ/RimL family protein N-acetyltransferase